MTFNARFILKCRALSDGTLDVRLLRVSDSTIRIPEGEQGEWTDGPKGLVFGWIL